MKDDTKEIAKAAGKSGILALLHFIPIAGEPISTGISEFVSERRAQNLTHFQQDVKDRFEKLELKLDDLYFTSEDLKEIVETIYEEIEKTRMQEKRALFAQALINSILRSQSNELSEEKEFINLLTTMPVKYMENLIELKTTTDGITLSSIAGAYNFLSSYGAAEMSVNVQGMTYGSAPVSYNFRITDKGLRFIDFVFDSSVTKGNL